MPQWFRFALFALVAASLFVTAVVTAQTADEQANLPTTAATASSTSTAPATATAPTTATAPALPVPKNLKPGQINERADIDTAKATSIETQVVGDRVVPEITEDFNDLLSEIENRDQETARLLAAPPSLDTLRGLEADWLTLARTLDEWKIELGKRSTLLDTHLATLTELTNDWWQPALDYIRATNAPPVLIQQAESVMEAIHRARGIVDLRRTTVLSLQSRVREASIRVADAQKSIATSQVAARNRLFVRDADSVWALVAGRNANTAIDRQQSLQAQWRTLQAYVSRRASTFIIHGACWLLLIPLLLWVRRTVRDWVKDDPTLTRTSLVFELPIATATVLALLVSGWIYPNAPRLLWAIIVAGALVPTIFILRRLLDRVLHPVLNALVLFNLVDQLRSVTASMPLITRLLFLAEMAGGAILLIWFIRSGRLKTAIGTRTGFWHGAIVGVARLYTVVFIVAGLAAAIGFFSLGTLLGNAILGSTYLAVILFVATRIADGLLMSALRIRPLSLLKAIQHNRHFVWRRLCRILHIATIVLWVLGTLELLSIRQIAVDVVTWIVTTPLTVGAFSLSLGQVIAFVLTVWFSIWASRFIRFLLEEDVYPRFYLARGLPYAISTVLHYLILLIGFTTAVQMLGYDMTKFTILAGAFGVGLGFGLQNIFNNFVSGLILLFERPIKVGDMVQIGTDTGRVRRIGIRASVIRLGTGAEIIMPNGKLISDPVTNWTLSARGRGIELPISVSNSVEPRQVIALWAKITAVHPKVSEDPAPKAIITGLATDALQVSLRAWTNDFDAWSETRSDLAIAMSAALKDAEISVK